MQFEQMFVTAVYVLFLLKSKTFYEIIPLGIKRVKKTFFSLGETRPTRCSIYGTMFAIEYKSVIEV